MYLTISGDLFRWRCSHVFLRVDTHNLITFFNHIITSKILDSYSRTLGPMTECFIVRDPPVTFVSHMWQRKQNRLPKRPVLLMSLRPMKSKRRGICFGIWYTIFQALYSSITPELAAGHYFATVKYWRYFTLYIKAKLLQVYVHRGRWLRRKRCGILNCCHRVCRFFQ
jgi:hypothetical protein